MLRTLSTLSVLGQYVETALQLYVVARLYVDDVMTLPSLLVTLCLISAAFVATSCASFVLDLRSRSWTSGRSWIVCAGLHAAQLGLAWRLGRLFRRYDQQSFHHLGVLRLVHVSLQTFPYVIIVGRPLAAGDVQPQPLAVLSLVVSLASSALALGCYSLRRRLHEGLVMDLVKFRTNKLRRNLGMVLLLAGTLLCLMSRLASFVLMAAEYGFWAAALPGVHMAAFLAIHVTCLRTTPRKTRAPFLEVALAGVGVSYLSVFELVEDQAFPQPHQCRYVAFYAVMLVENIIMMALWLLYSRVDYIAKLLVVVGLLVIFLCALVIKFTSCGLVALRVRGNPVSDAADLAAIFQHDASARGHPGDANGKCVVDGGGKGPFTSSCAGSKRSASVATISSHSGDVLRHHRCDRHRPRHRCRHHSDSRQGDTSRTTSTMLSDATARSASHGRSRGCAAAASTPHATTVVALPETDKNRQANSGGPKVNAGRCLLRGDDPRHLQELLNKLVRSDSPRRFSSFTKRDYLDSGLFDDPLLASCIVTSPLRSHATNVSGAVAGGVPGVECRKHKNSTAFSARSAKGLNTQTEKRLVGERETKGRVHSRRFSCDVHKVRGKTSDRLRPSRSESLKNHKAPSPEFNWSEQSVSSTVDSLQTTSRDKSASRFASSTSSSLSSEASPYRWPTTVAGVTGHEHAATWPRRKAPLTGCSARQRNDTVPPRDALSALDAVRLWLDNVCHDVPDAGQDGQVMSLDCTAYSPAAPRSCNQQHAACAFLAGEVQEHKRETTRKDMQSYPERLCDIREGFKRAPDDLKGTAGVTSASEDVSTRWGSAVSGTTLLGSNCQSNSFSTVDVHGDPHIRLKAGPGMNSEGGQTFEELRYQCLPCFQLDMCESLV